MQTERESPPPHINLPSSNCDRPPLYSLLLRQDDTSLSLVSAAAQTGVAASNFIFLSFLKPQQHCNSSQVLLFEHEWKHDGENTLNIKSPSGSNKCVCAFGLTVSSFNSGERSSESHGWAATRDGSTAHPSLAVFSPTPDENTNKQSIVFSHSLGPR